MFENIQPTTPMPVEKINLMIAWLKFSNSLTVDPGSLGIQIFMTSVDASKFLSALPDDCLAFPSPTVQAEVTGMFFMRYLGHDRISTLVDDHIVSGGLVTDFVRDSVINQALLDTWIAHNVVTINSGYFILSPRIYNLIEAVK